ncbi:hypothetical protein FQA39_LY19438 [Lamprigera yunnana]|nr:hypothetical protein FQA39_LY19438 [Lamprigera yunnana]
MNAISPTGSVPLLRDGDIAVWDSLAIAEYLAEQHPGKQLWPKDKAARAMARSICAEMHGGFGALRSACGMNIEADLAEHARANWVAQGFVPVGKDFPVFLHPQTHEEYALARTERKSGRGYHGFTVLAAPQSRCQEDLARRDLTINAIAAPADWAGASGIIDPYNGQADLQRKVLRHVTDAFREDPVRILRVARFAARFADFAIAPETMQLMRQMVADGEVDALVPERVWQELARGLMEAAPSRMFSVLRDCGALARLLPEVDRLWGLPQPPTTTPKDTGVHVMMVLDRAAELAAPLPVRWACVAHTLGRRHPPPTCCPATSATKRAAWAWPAPYTSACACPAIAPSWRSWWPPSTATSTAAAAYRPPPCCACWSAATPFANPIALPPPCWPASATPKAAWACSTSPTRSAQHCCTCWPGRRNRQHAPEASRQSRPIGPKRRSDWCHGARGACACCCGGLASDTPPALKALVGPARTTTAHQQLQARIAHPPPAAHLIRHSQVINSPQTPSILGAPMQDKNYQHAQAVQMLLADGSCWFFYYNNLHGMNPHV